MASGLILFRTRLLYRRSGTETQFQADMDKIAALDKRSEKLSQWYAKLSALGCIGGLVSIFVVAFSLVALEDKLNDDLILLILTIPGWLALLYWLTSYVAQYYERTNVPDIRYGILPPLAKMLARDMAEAETLNARIDFSSPTLKKKRTAKGPYIKRRGWKQALYADPWFRLSGKFLDNTEFTLSLKEFAVVRSGVQRSRSGKMKRKTKTKSKGVLMTLLLKFSRKRYGAIALFQEDLSSAVVLPSGIQLQKIKANDHKLFMQIRVPAHSHLLMSSDGIYQLFTRMLLSAYQVLNLSKTLSKAA